MVEVPSSNFTVLGFPEAVSKPGQSVVSVVGTYNNQKTDCSVYITVVGRGVPISLLTASVSKEQYFVGDTIDKDTVIVKYKGVVVPSSEWSHGGMDSSTPGRKTITIYYDTTPGEPGGVVSTTISIYVEKSNTTVLSAVTTRGVYRRGESFDYDSLKVTLHTPDGSNKVIPSRRVNIIGFDTMKVSNIEPIVEYNGLTAPINVIE
jgi:hypothetical protein